MNYLSCTYPISLKDPLSYLEEKSIYPKVFWQNSLTIRIGLGKLISSDSVPIFDDIKDDCWFGSIPFMDKAHTQENPWEGFIFPGFFLPQIYLQLDPHNYKGTITFRYFKSPPSKEEIDFYLQDSSFIQSSWEVSFLERHDSPSFDKWSSLIKEALETFERSPLKKVVLARATSLLFKEPINPMHIVKHLKSHGLNSTLFAYIPDRHNAFIGSSPEAFYTRQDRKLETAAVAGTRKRGLNKGDDQALYLELINGSKEREEFQYVLNFFEEALSNLSEHYDKTSDTSIKQTTTVQHLYHKFQAYLQSSITDQTLIKTLHPTPAVGGLPQELALEFLKDKEPFYRGLYAAPLGWISKRQTDLIVAIRSSLINNYNLTLFAGAGIVNGSDPASEWEELEHKISQFIRKPSYAR